MQQSGLDGKPSISDKNEKRTTVVFFIFLGDTVDSRLLFL